MLSTVRILNTLLAPVQMIWSLCGYLKLLVRVGGWGRLTEKFRTGRPRAESQHTMISSSHTTERKIFEKYGISKTNSFIRDTQRIVSVNYPFGRPLIPYDFLKGIFTSNFRDMGNLRSSVFGLIKMSFRVPKKGQLRFSERK